MRRIAILALVLISVFCLSSCSRQPKYKITKESQSDDSNRIDVYFPQIDGLEDKEFEAKVNRQIMDTATSVFDDFTSLDDMDIQTKYSVTLKNDNYISVIFEFTTMHVAQAYPLIRNKTLTLDLKTGEKLVLSDIINIDQDLVDNFSSLFYNKTKYEDFKNKKEIQGYVQNEIKEYQTVNDLRTCDNLNNVDYQSYMTDDSVGISISIRHQIGSYALYEAKFSKLSKYMKISVNE